MKKLVLAALLLCLLLVLTGCGCKHEETQLINVVEATCTEVGYSGDTYCPKCEKTITQGEEIAAKGHTAGELVNVVEATCVEEGYSGDVPCVDCGEILEAGEVLPMMEHTPGEREYAYEATCSREGYTGDVSCTYCYCLIEIGEFIPKLDHTPAEELKYVREATCTNEGYTGDLLCVDCDELLQAGETIPVLEHVPGEYTNVADPTCMLDGYSGDTVCTACGTELLGEVIPKHGHSYEGNDCTVCGWKVPGLYIDNQLAFTWQQLWDNGYIKEGRYGGIGSVVQELYGTLVIEEGYSLSDSVSSGFRGCNLNAIYFPPSVEKIYLDRFRGCTALEEVYLFGVREIHSDVFSGCTNLKKAVLKEGLVGIGGGAFANCSSLETIELPSTVRTIGKKAFKNCSALKEINLPDGIKSIGMEAFANCTALTNLEFPDGIETIGYDLVSGSSVQELIIPASVTELGTQTHNSLVTLDCSNVSVETLEGYNAFEGCAYLENLELPPNLVNLNEGSFAGCTNLQRLELPEGFKEFKRWGGGKSMQACEALTTIVWPSSLLDGSHLATAPNITEVLYMGNELQWSLTASKDMFPNATITFNYQPE